MASRVTIVMVAAEAGVSVLGPDDRAPAASTS